MDLTTPNKKESSSSLSQFEDSPVFNYINNLSPIDLVKSINVEPPLNSLSFPSPPSVFASPQLRSHRETTRFLIKRLQSSDLSKTEVTKRKDDNAISKDDVEGSKLSDLCAESRVSLDNNANVVRPSGKELELAIELPKGLRCDCDSPDRTTVPCIGTCTDSDVAVAGNDNDMSVAYTCEKDLRKISALEQVEDGGEGDWVSLLSDSADVLSFDSSVIEEDFEEQKMVDPGTISFVSNVLEIPQDYTGNLENLETIACVDSCNAIEDSVEFEDQKDGEDLPTFSGTLLNKAIVSSATPKTNLNGKQCCQFGCKNKIRRRCLVFEMTGAHKKKPARDSNGGFSASSQSDSEAANMENYSTPGKTGKASTLCMLSGRGFGLHLNSLATMTNDGKSVKIDTGTSVDKQPKLDLVPFKKDGIIENATETPTGASEDYGISSPKTKGSKIEHAGASCKRCNCKRSKCLKLYCECFAAGLYCIEPCSCQDCFNKPAHEDTVLETRRQIESRNPLAFAPKVIMSAESFSDFGDETNKTPASARHKRGCNCKKSSCLKKYCECFQGGVGCSSGCRCEGCKNTYGTRNGVEINEGRESEACDRDASDITLKHEMVKHAVDENPDHPTHSDNARPSIRPLITFGQQFSGTSRSAVGPSIQIVTGQKLRADLLCRQPKFDSQLQPIPEDETPEILTDRYSPTSGVKSTSPNSKRVSPPHQESASSNPWKKTRKLILRSVPPFPSLSSPSNNF